MNSFRFIERGIKAEIERQRKIIEGGGEVTQETLHYDPASGAISSLRSKEEAHDYRYFPEPDLLPVAIDEQMLAAAREAMSELPAERAARFEAELELSADSAQQLAFRSELGDYFEAALAAGRRSARARAGARELGQRRSARAARRRRGPGRLARRAGRARRARRPRREQADQRRRRAPGARQADRRGRRAGARSSRQKGSPRSAGATSSPRSSPPRLPRTLMPPSACAAGTRRRSGRSSAP